MQDRVATYPGRVKLTPVSGQANTYDLERADQPTVQGTALNKANLLSDTTANLLGLGTNPTVNDALNSLATKVADIKISRRTDLPNNYLLCNGTTVSANDYQELGTILGVGADLAHYPTPTTLETITSPNQYRNATCVSYVNGYVVAFYNRRNASNTNNYDACMAYKRESETTWTKKVLFTGTTQNNRVNFIKYFNDRYYIGGQYYDSASGKYCAFVGYSTTIDGTYTKKPIKSTTYDNNDVTDMEYANGQFVCVGQYTSYWSYSQQNVPFIAFFTNADINSVTTVDTPLGDGSSNSSRTYNRIKYLDNKWWICANTTMANTAYPVIEYCTDTNISSSSTWNIGRTDTTSTYAEYNYYAKGVRDVFEIDGDIYCCGSSQTRAFIAKQSDTGIWAETTLWNYLNNDYWVTVFTIKKVGGVYVAVGGNGGQAVYAYSESINGEWRLMYPFSKGTYYPCEIVDIACGQNNMYMLGQNGGTIMIYEFPATTITLPTITLNNAYAYIRAK